MHPLTSKQPAGEVGKMVAIKTKNRYLSRWFSCHPSLSNFISLSLGFDLSFDIVFTVKINIYKYALYSFQV